MIIVFDGLCNGCDAFVRFLSARDAHGRLTFVPALSQEGRRLLASCGELPEAPSTMLVVDKSGVRMRSDAILAAVAALGGGWRCIGLLSVIPRPLRDALYDMLARHRYRWFGSAENCERCSAVAPWRGP